MQLFYAPDITGDFYTFSADESRHIVQVLRLGLGSTLHITDGKGTLCTARITQATAKCCSVEIIERITDYERRNYRLWMAVTPTKNIDRFEWFLEKATEIGLDHITPLLCERSERKIVKTERSEKVVLSAVKQSLKAYMPQIDELTVFKDFLKTDFGNCSKYIAHCCSDFQRVELSKTIKPGESAVILIGAEGDFSPSEILAANNAGFIGISLGNNRLRTETAALMAVATLAIINN